MGSRATLAPFRSDIPSAETLGGDGREGDRMEVDTPPGGNTGVALHSTAIETALVPMQTELAALTRQVNDQGRQTSKDEIVFEGTAVRPKENETELQTLQRILKTHWDLDLIVHPLSEIKQIHFLPSGNKEKPKLLAKFLNLFKGSNFHQILHTRPKFPNSGVTLYRRLHTQTRNDNRLSFISRQMRKDGEITRFVFDSVSGRLKVTFPDGTRQTFSEASDLLARCTPRLFDKITQLDKGWKRRPGLPGPRSGK